MTNYFLKSLFLLSITVSIVSCSKNETATSVENYTNTALREINESCRGGEAGCFEFVFPISIQFSDGTVVSVDGQDALRDAIKTYKENNPGEKARPEILFPVDIMTEDGSIVTIATKEELRDVIKECKGSFDGGGRPGHGGGRPGHGGHGTEPCFTINFPVTIAFPDSTTQTFVDKVALKAGLKAWRQANHGVKERPELVFPISVTKEDGTVVIVNSKEELIALKRECRG